MSLLINQSQLGDYTWLGPGGNEFIFERGSDMPPSFSLDPIILDNFSPNFLGGGNQTEWAAVPGNLGVRRLWNIVE